MKMKWENGKFKSPLARARGLGSAQNGSCHWMHQRMTALAAIPLMIWLVWSVVHMRGWEHEHFTMWLSSPVNAILMILSILVTFYHAALGMQVIIEDYIHGEGCKMAKLILMKLFFSAAAVACIFSVLKIALAT